MRVRRPTGNRRTTADLAAWYVTTGLAATGSALVAGLVGALAIPATGLGCRPVTGGDVPTGGQVGCPDGTGYLIPGLVAVIAGGLVTVVVAAALLRRRAEPPALATVARVLVWLAGGIVAVPGVALAVVAGAAPPLVVVGCSLVPAVVVTRWPARAVPVLAGGLVGAVAVLAFGRALPLLVPVSVLLAGLWATALVLLGSAPNPVRAVRLVGRRFPGGSATRPAAAPPPVSGGPPRSRSQGRT